MFGKKPFYVVFGLAIVAVFAMTAAAPFNPGSPTPDNFDKFLVYMADGQYDPNDPGYAAPTAEEFQREVMQRSDEEVAQDRAAAIEFYNQRFGLNLTDPGGDLFAAFTTADGVMFTPFYFDPRNEYRAYVVSNERVPSAGWVIRDGGWSASIVNPDGFTLGGEYDGIHVPQGTMFAFGDYNIERTLPSGKVIEPLVIHYQSGGPIIMNSDLSGGMFFRCELISEEFGTGLAQGVVAPEMMPDGTIHQNIRNVLTFPGLGEVTN